MNRKKVNKLIGKIKRQVRECAINNTTINIKLTRADMRYMMSDINVYRSVILYIIKLQDNTVFKRLSQDYIANDTRVVKEAYENLKPNM